VFPSEIADAARSAFAQSPARDSPDAVLLLKRNGDSLGSWTRTPASEEVLTVMAAVVLGSIETIIETLGGACPEDLTIEARAHRLLFKKLEPQTVLVMIGPKTQQVRALRRQAEQLLKQVPALRAGITASAEPSKIDRTQKTKRRGRPREHEPLLISR